MNYILILFVGIIIGILLFFILNRIFYKPQNLVRSNPIAYSEEQAEKIIGDNGYLILEKQKKFPIIIFIDGKSHLGFIIADYLVEKDKKKYVIYVKTGEEPDLLEPKTRQILLEYDYVCSPTKLLVLNIDRVQIHEISFKLPEEERDSFLKIFIPVFILLLLIGIIGLFIALKIF